MRIKLISFFFLLVPFLLMLRPVLASGFSLKRVGALNVDGALYKHLWYTNSNLTFTGNSLENAQITVDIDGESTTLTADSSGGWSYRASLANGDHNIRFTSGGSTISFVLTIGSDIPGGLVQFPRRKLQQ